MIKRVLFSVLLMVTVFSCVGWSQNLSIDRFEFTINTPYLLERGALLALPAGEYYVRDIGTAPGHLLSLQTRERRHVAWLNTVRIDRHVVNWADEPTAVFDYENSVLPVFKKFYLPGTDGYEILSSQLDTKAKVNFIEVASLNKVSYTITERKIEEAAPAAAEPPAEEVPEETAPPAPAVEQPKKEMPPAEPVTPIRERTRVRKD